MELMSIGKFAKRVGIILSLIVTVFANRLYGQRSKKTKRLIDEVKNNDPGDKDQIKTN